MGAPAAIRQTRRDPLSHGRFFMAVCFDLDGVLIDTMPLHAQAWQEALRPFELAVSRRSIYAWEGEPGTVTARTLLSRNGHVPSRHMVDSLLHEKERRFARLAGQIRINPQLLALLGRLSRQGIRLGLVTGTSSREIARVLSRSVLVQFDAIVTGDRVRRGKPYPDAYHAAFRTLRVPAASAVVVENAPYGITAARRARAGLVVALASSLPRAYLRHAHVTVGTVGRLCALLERVTAD